MDTSSCHLLSPEQVGWLVDGLFYTESATEARQSKTMIARPLYSEQVGNGLQFYSDEVIQVNEVFVTVGKV